jgi:hypothetical protein
MRTQFIIVMVSYNFFFFFGNPNFVDFWFIVSAALAGTHPVWRLEEPVDGRQLVDEGQGDAEGVLGRPGGVREVGGVREGVDVVQILYATCQRHYGHFTLSTSQCV